MRTLIPEFIRVLAAKIAGDHNRPVYIESPEDNPKNWACPCGNKVLFVGMDDHGYGGPDECECGAYIDGDAVLGHPVCSCECTLTQRITVADGEAVDWDCFDGGGHDAEIGSYDRVYCGVCEQLLWAGPNADREAVRS